MNGYGPFIQVYREPMHDRTISVGARCAYSIITEIGWSAGRRRGDETFGFILPPHQELAAEIGVAVTTVKGYLVELRQARYIFTRKSGPRGLLCFLFNARATDELLSEVKKIGQNPPIFSQEDRSESAYLDRPETDLSSGALLPYREIEQKESLTGLRERPVPDAVLIDGQNLPFNALRDSCLPNPENVRRLPEVAAALNGARGKPGIRELFWQECRTRAKYLGREEDLGELTPEHFALLLAETIPQRARMYVERMPGATLTPLALAKWWLDLERMKPREGGMTPEEVKRVADAA